MPILVVDDEPVFRSAVKTVLRNAGFHIIEAQDGLEAYEIVRAIGGSIELLLTDFRMPRMDGLSLIQSVRELYPKMPIVLMTGSRLEHRPGGYKALNKPIGRDVLLETVLSTIAAAGPEKPKRRVEVFSSGSRCSEELITAIRAAACPSCEITVLDLASAEAAERANKLGVQSVPAVAINDKLVCCPCECGPDLAKLRAAGLGVRLS